MAAVKFNPDFLNRVAGGDIDISRFNGDYRILPGNYFPDIYINGRLVGRSNMNIAEKAGHSLICINQEIITLSGIKTRVISPELMKRLAEPAQCMTIKELLPDASAVMNLSAMRLDLSIPQAHLNQLARGYVPPSMWTYGVNGLFASYNTSYFEQHNGNNVSRSLYGDLRAGLNLGTWLLRHAGTLRWDQTAGSGYNRFITNVQRDIIQLSSRLLIGDSSTSGEIFDSFPFRGVQLATADLMLPDSLRGYAPVVRGIAKTNAKITIKQRGNVIYETTVPPGEFSINDLYPSGYGGDLDVTVTEADGTLSSFSVPFSSVTQLLRPGMRNYSLVAGQLRNLNRKTQPLVVQATYKQGISNLLTVYTGLTSTGNWGSGVIGSALGTPVGAFSFDISGTRFKYKEESRHGVSMKASYSKLLTSTNSNISLAAYRFSSPGYLDIYNAVYLQDLMKSNPGGNLLRRLNRPKNRISLTLSQPLNDILGQMYLSGFRENYWNKGYTNTQFQLGYNNHYGLLSYGLSINKIFSQADSETQYLLNFSLPLGSGQHAANINSYTTLEKKGSTSQSGISGQAGERNQMGYNASASKNKNNHYSGSLNGNYVFSGTTINAGYSGGQGYYGLSGGLSGSIVGISDGLVLSPYSNLSTMAVVSAQHAGGATIEGYSGVRLDKNGMALVPYLNPYRINQISVNPKGLPWNVELQNTSQQVAPHQGAIVRIDYPTQRGRMVLIRAELPDGHTLPFGAVVKKENGEDVGVVAQGGQIYVRLKEDDASLSVHWGSNSEMGCNFTIEPDPQPLSAPKAFTRLHRICQPLSSDALRHGVVKPALMAHLKTPEQPEG
ncbi:fimbria/pilus outer membrane usher protein [Erwinia tasmaniensis]|uniref:fimbria/pilus outer membrane usher protein n=1 Tax=Erwinia tasmaniensis TaxID=338565 RepID=UPI003A4DEC3F